MLVSLELVNIGYDLRFSTKSKMKIILVVAPNPLSQPAKPIGLGGVDMNATQPKANEGKVEGKTTKEDKVPQEIASTVESLKQHIKQQKTLSADIGRSASHKLISVCYLYYRL